MTIEIFDPPFGQPFVPFGSMSLLHPDAISVKEPQAPV